MSMGLIDKETIIRTAQNIIGNEAGYKAWAILNAIREAPDAVIRCKDCKHRGNSEKCVLSAISEEKDFPLFILDNRGDWFCADGERRDVND